MNLSRAYSLDVRRGPLRRTRADADARDAGRARTRDPALRARGLPRRSPRRSTRKARRPTAYKGTWLRDRAAAGADKESLQQAMRLPADGEEAGADRGARAHRTGGHRIHRSRDAAHAAAAALRPDRAAAARQPPVRLQRAEDARHGAGALRAAQADQLSAHGQPPSLAGRGEDAAARSSRRSSGPIATTWRRARASGRWAAASSTMPKSPTTTRSSPRPLAGAGATSRRTSARSTT